MRIFDESELIIVAADAAKYLASGPGNHYVMIVRGSKSDDLLTLSPTDDSATEELRLRLENEEPSVTDPDA